MVSRVQRRWISIKVQASSFFVFCFHLTLPHFATLCNTPFTPFFSTPPTVRSLFSLTCGKHYILSGGDWEQTSQAEAERLLGSTGGQWECCSGSAWCWLPLFFPLYLPLTPFSHYFSVVWTKEGVVIPQPEDLLADKHHSSTTLVKWTHQVKKEHSR